MMRTFVVPALAVLLTAVTAAAQTSGDGIFPVERFRPAMAREGILDVETAGVMAPFQLDAALWLGYAHNPLVLYRLDGPSDTREAALVDTRVAADLVGAMSFTDWLQVGLDVPITLFQSGELSPVMPGRGELTGVGLGDMRFMPKLSLTRVPLPVDVGLMATFTVPTATPGDRYLGESTFSWVPELIVSRKLGGLMLAANAGYRLRRATRVMSLRVGSEITYRVGASYAMAGLTARPVQLAASVSGSTSDTKPFQSWNRSPLELLLGAAYEVVPDVQVLASAGSGLVAGYGAPDLRVLVAVRYSPRDRDRDGDGLLEQDDRCPDDAEDRDGFEDDDGCPESDNDGDGVFDTDDACPNEAEDADEFEDEDGCPDADNDKDGLLDASDRCPNEAEDMDGFQDDDGCADPDNDGDGLADTADKCPSEAEDADGFQDADGCPDLDNDKDGFPDASDKCPNEAEIVNNVADDDGCPDQGESKVELTQTKIEIRDKVFFDTGKATIQKRSHDLLRQVATLLRLTPQISKLRVEGHTDDRGSDKKNLELSRRRADAVRAFLIEQGLHPDQLVSEGFGETRPIASNKKESGREMNRRVEFVILELDGKPVPQAAP